MGAISTRVKNRVISGLRYGGQISTAVIDEHIEAVLDEIYSRTEVARYDLPAIDETEGVTKYELPDLLGTPAGFRVCRILSVCRVSYVQWAIGAGGPDGYGVGALVAHEGSFYVCGVENELNDNAGYEPGTAPGATYWTLTTSAEPETVSRIYLNDDDYNLDAAVGDDGDADAQVLTLKAKSPADGTGTLVVRVVASFSDDSYFPASYSRDIELAATARIMEFLCSESGKPWSDANRAVLEERKFRGALNRLRSKSLQRGTGRSTRCRATQSFI